MADAERPGLIQGIKLNYSLTKRAYPLLALELLSAFVLGFAIGFAVFYFAFGRHVWLAIVPAIVLGLLLVMIWLGRRAQRAIYHEIRGELGAAGRALHMLRRGWQIEVPVAFNKSQDMVHRVVGPPGIVLVGEGNPNRVKPLLAAERKKHERVAQDVPVTEVVVGDEPGEVRLEKLVNHLTKMKRAIKPAEMTAVLSRLRALDATTGKLPLPKGPIPTSMKGMRSQMRGR